MSMMTIIFIICVFVCVAALAAAVGMMLSPQSVSVLEDRLDVLTGTSESPTDMQQTSLLTHQMDNGDTFAEKLFSHFGKFNISRFLEQSGLRLTPSKFLLYTAACAGVGALIGVALNLHVGVVPSLAMAFAVLPFTLVYLARRQRFASFGRHLPEALELISRALRAGHSLAAGFSLVGEEMKGVIGAEFARCYEEQNLGIPLEEALEDMTERIPNLDLRFFATAIILQRQTGGDLAEILDKIGELIRERFKIWGQIQALTGEGRLSGIVLLSLPPVLFLALYRLNPDYCMILFEDPMGQQMLAVAVVMQFLGAVVIKKIINIKV